MSGLLACNINDRDIVEWLRSNPVADPYTTKTEVILLWYENGNGAMRWPVVPPAALSTGDVPTAGKGADNG